MITALYFVAFPGLSLVAALWWWNAAGAYRRSIERSPLSERASRQPEGVGPSGMLAALEKRADIDRRVRNGQLGDEALRALEHERLAFKVLALSGPLGIAGIWLLRVVLPRTSAAVSDAEALVVAAFGVGLVGVAFLIAQRIAVSFRVGNRREAIAFGVSLIVVLVASAIALRQFLT